MYASWRMHTMLARDSSTPVSDRSSSSLRNPYSLALPFCSSVRWLKAFLPPSVSLWNDLPLAVTAGVSSSAWIPVFPLTSSHGRPWPSGFPMFFPHCLWRKTSFVLNNTATWTQVHVQSYEHKHTQTLKRLHALNEAKVRPSSDAIKQNYFDITRVGCFRMSLRRASLRGSYFVENHSHAMKFRRAAL